MQRNGVRIRDSRVGRTVLGNISGSRASIHVNGETL
jgi:hypothetical protein